MRIAAIAFLLTCTAVFAQQKGTFTDTRDKKKYKTVKIGEQTWFAENLNFNAKGSKCYGEGGKVFAGEGIAESVVTKKLSSAEIQTNCAKYGRLYNWAAAMALPSSCNPDDCTDRIQQPHRGICPSGWHIPNAEEWQILVDFAGGNEIAGKKLKATSGWNNDGNGTDDYGFSALPGGFFEKDANEQEYFNEVGNNGGWWSSSEINSLGALWVSYDGYESHLFSIRCVKD